MPITRELKGIYSEAKYQSSTVLVQARCSVIYDVQNKYVLNGVLEPIKRGERDLGYLMRVKTSFSGLVKDFEKSRKKSVVVAIYPGKNAKLSDKEYNKNSPIKVRLVRIELGKGNVEILMTSLLDSNLYPTGQFKKLYFKRWGVETFYDELKNKLRVEHFSGYSNQSILQDFKAALFVSNVQTLIVSEIEDELKDSNQGKKYEYKVNKNISYGLLKNRVVTLFLDEKPTGSDILEELKSLYISHLVPISPNRKFERNTGKYRSRIKPKVTKNHKDGI